MCAAELGTLFCASTGATFRTSGRRRRGATVSFALGRGLDPGESCHQSVASKDAKCRRLASRNDLLARSANT